MKPINSLLSLINYVGSFLLWLFLVSLNHWFIFSALVIFPMTLYFFVLIFINEDKNNNFTLDKPKPPINNTQPPPSPKRKL